MKNSFLRLSESKVNNKAFMRVHVQYTTCLTKLTSNITKFIFNFKPLVVHFSHVCEHVVFAPQNYRQIECHKKIQLPDKCSLSANYMSFYVFSGWTMVFKAVSGTQSLFWDELNSVFTYAEFETAALDVTMDYRGTYKNRILFYWENFNVNEASNHIKWQ